MITLNKFQEGKDRFAIKTIDADGREVAIKVETISPAVSGCWVKILDVLHRLIGWQMQEVGIEVNTKGRKWKVRVSCKVKTSTYKKSKVSVDVPLVSIDKEMEETDEALMVRLLRSMDGLVRADMVEMAGLRQGQQLSLFGPSPKFQPHKQSIQATLH